MASFAFYTTMETLAQKLARILVEQNCHLGTFEVCLRNVASEEKVIEALRGLGCGVHVDEHCDRVTVTCAKPTR